MKTKLVAFILTILAVIFCTWQITLHTMEISVNEDTPYVSSFGFVNEYDYTPLWK